MDRGLRDLMERVVREGTERLFAHLTLREDPFFHRLPPEMRPEAVEFGLNAGAGAAESAAERFGREPVSMAAALRISVIRSDDSPRAGSMVHFSEYREKPPQVTLHRRSMAEANHLIQEHGLEGLLGLADVEPIHLAHELCHHLEAKRLRRLAGRGCITFQTGWRSAARDAQQAARPPLST